MLQPILVLESAAILILKGQLFDFFLQFKLVFDNKNLAGNVNQTEILEDIRLETGRTIAL